MLCDIRSTTGASAVLEAASSGIIRHRRVVRLDAAI
jgi:hypothetical protein